MTVGLPLILVVDDNPWFRDFLDDLLSMEGYRVLLAEPDAALAAVSAEPPALALLDAVMPGYDGPRLCRELRATEATRAMPILFITGLPEQALVTQLADCDGWAYLQKPCTPEQLLDAVRKCLASPGAAAV